ncbi:MAG: hypothetical protein ACLUDU_06570 [Butyricimonas faecihominis]
MSVNLSEEFVYKVDVVQSGEERPLTYEWGMRPIIPRMSDYPAKDSLKLYLTRPSYVILSEVGTVFAIEGG